MAIQITAAMVNELRQKTGVGMMQCKKVLIEAEGDQDKAVELLRKQGAAVAAKRADKAAKEGRIYLVETADKAAAFELSCETEPVSNNADFVALANMAVKAVETQAIASVEDLKNAVVDGKKVNDVLQDVLVKIQENIDFRKFQELKKAPNSVFGVYSHMNGKIGVITELSYEGSADEAGIRSAPDRRSRCQGPQGNRSRRPGILHVRKEPEEALCQGLPPGSRCKAARSFQLEGCELRSL